MRFSSMHFESVKLVFKAISRTYPIHTQYLLSDEIERAAGGLKDGGPNPMFLGRRVRRQWDGEISNHGGPSHVLNQASVGLLASQLDDDSSQPHTRRSWEDVLVRNLFFNDGCTYICDKWRTRPGV